LDRASVVQEIKTLQARILQTEPHWNKASGQTQRALWKLASPVDTQVVVMTSSSSTKEETQKAPASKQQQHRRKNQPPIIKLDLSSNKGFDIGV
jgi:hypothetical protein